VTVIAPTTVAADIFAKTLFISGYEKGLALAESLHIPVIFMEYNSEVHMNSYSEKYVWKS